MCNQTVSLLAAAIESRGIPTTCIVLLRDVAERVKPPRALFVPYPHGYPLGAPNDAETQKHVMRSAFALLTSETGPVLRNA
ncbi:MAG: hypothetical protein ACTHQM_16215 [Thermoanaerobaculia bacterium]